MITEDFVALTSGELHKSGVVLEDRSTHEHLRVHSLLELEMGRVYVSPRGNPVRRLNKTHALMCRGLAVSERPFSKAAQSEPISIGSPNAVPVPCASQKATESADVPARA